MKRRCWGKRWRSAQVALKASGPVGVSPVSLCPQVFISTKELPYVPACNTASGCSISPHTHNHQQPWQHSLSLSLLLTRSVSREIKLGSKAFCKCFLPSLGLTPIVHFTISTSLMHSNTWIVGSLTYKCPGLRKWKTF